MNRKFLIIDGHNLLFRAYFALPPMATRDGIATNAIRGVIMMVLKLLRDEKPDFLAIAWDPPGKTFRDEIFPAYKAQREKAPDDLYTQVALTKEVLTAMGVTNWEEELYEADDLMATAVKKSNKKQLQVVLFTADMDLLQLVDENVEVLSPKRGMSELLRYDKRQVHEQLGIRPHQVPDYKGLCGDTSDNLPGVKGVGPKTARTLLDEFGSLEKIYEDLSIVKNPRIRNLLETGAAQAEMCKELATLDSDAPLDFSLGDIQSPNFKFKDDNLVQILKGLELNNIINQLGLRDVLLANLDITCSMAKTPDDIEPINDLIRKAGEVFFSSSRSGGIFSGVVISLDDKQCVYVKFEENLNLGDGEKSLFNQSLNSSHGKYLKNWFAGILSDISIKKVTHDFKPIFLGFPGESIAATSWEDVMLTAYLLEPGVQSYDFTYVAEKLGINVNVLNSDDIDEEIVDLSSSAAIIRSAYNTWTGNIAKTGTSKLLKDIEIPLIPVLAAMEINGVKIDISYLETLGKELAVEIEMLEGKIYRLGGGEFNINSPKQLQSILFDKLSIPATKKTKTGHSTAATVLEPLADDYEIIRDILSFREIDKLRNTFIVGLVQLARKDTGRIHTTFHQTGTSTGRLSSSNPNLQNIPIRSDVGKKIRKAFVAPPGKLLLSADYSQIELRILAHLSGDENLMEAFQNEQDIHTRTATEIFEVDLADVDSNMRRIAKIVNFGIAYGISAFGLSNQLGVNLKDAQSYIDGYFSNYPGVKTYVDFIIKGARNNQYVSTILGRRRYLREINSGDQRRRQSAERAAINMPVQGSSADIIKIAMVRIADEMARSSPDVKMLLQVHDELLFEVSPEEIKEFAEKVKVLMENSYELSVPLKVNLQKGENWLEMSGI